ncbi:hypothetical protein O181_075999 [Austropuccinia psidii MF-1]|uniref:Uncharacterized protein n=1 Tax=Austropuccinia psidii MF-1 TaxID=1389203 RepID=A0A9Q3FC30_9BASI|nr:hypothetical protein [Austropuccinia psidii MF-1]
MENAFESSIFKSEKDKALTWFLKQKDRLSSLHPDVSDSIINIQILRKCGGELDHDIKYRCIEPCSKKDKLIQWKISLLRQELVKPGIESLWIAKWSQRFPENTRDLKDVS